MIHSESLLFFILDSVPLSETTFSTDEQRSLDEWTLCQSSTPLSEIRDSDLVRTTFSTFLLALLSTPSLWETANQCLASYLRQSSAPSSLLKAIPEIPAGFKGALHVTEAYWLSLLELCVAHPNYLLQHRVVQMICAVLASAPQRIDASPYRFCSSLQVRSALKQAVQRFIDVPSFVTLLVERWPFSPSQFSFVELFALHTSLPIVLTILIDAHRDFAPLLAHCNADPERNALWDRVLQTFMLRWDALEVETVGSLLRSLDPALAGNLYVFVILKRLVERNTAGSLLLVVSAVSFCTEFQKQVDFGSGVQSRSYNAS